MKRPVLIQWFDCCADRVLVSEEKRPKFQEISSLLKLSKLSPIYSSSMKLYPSIRYTTMAIIGLLIALQGNAQFRGCKFGMSLEEISKIEKSAFLRTTPTSVLYGDTLFGFDVLVAYHLSNEDDTFSMGSYTIGVVGYEIDEIMDHYIEVVTVMNERYGPSLKKGVIWWTEDSQYKDDLVNAFRFGEASFRNEWYGPGVHVVLTLSNDINTQGKIHYRIVYEPAKEYDREADMKKL